MYESNRLACVDTDRELEVVDKFVPTRTKHTLSIVGAEHSVVESRRCSTVNDNVGFCLPFINASDFVDLVMLILPWLVFGCDSDDASNKANKHVESKAVKSQSLGIVTDSTTKRMQ